MGIFYRSFTELGFLQFSDRLKEIVNVMNEMDPKIQLIEGSFRPHIQTIIIFQGYIVSKGHTTIKMI